MRPGVGLRVLWLLGAGAFLAQWAYAERAGVDARAHDQYTRRIRSLPALDARLNEQVMQSRQALVTHYDDLSATVFRLRETHARLAEPPQFVPGEHAAELRTGVKTSAAALADKVRVVEAFKAENAILRNSSRFFPVAARELRERLLARAETTPLAASVNELLVEVLHYKQLPSAPQLAKAEEAAAALEKAAFPADLARDRDVVLLHARTLLVRSGKVARLTNEVLTLPVAKAFEEVDAAYGRGLRAAEIAADRRRGLMFATVLGIVALMAADFVQRFRRAARAERETAEKLAQANAALLREKEREAELSDLKGRFVSMTSHEFRTPLAVILSSTELLEAYGERWQATKRSDHYTRIKTAVGTMRELLDAVLVIGRSDAGRLDCRPAPLDVVRFLREAIDAVASTSLRHDFRTHIDEPLPSAEIDEKLASHVITNLLSNAVKYSPAGGPIDVHVRPEKRDLVMEVKDRGIGITKADLGSLFESFHRGRNVGTIPGTGLGLAVVKRAVDAHGGSIDVRSEEGEGTTFTVRLPVFPDEDDQREAVLRPSRPDVDATVS